MSVDATRWAWMQQGIPAPTKLVLLSLADRANETHQAYPSQKRLAADTGFCVRTVGRALQKLQDKALIKDVGTMDSGTLIYELIGVPSREDDELPPKPKSKPKPSKSESGDSLASGDFKISADCRQAARAEFRDYDIDALERIWREWVKKRIDRYGDKECPRYPDKAFMGWARKYAEANPANMFQGSSEGSITVPQSYLDLARRCQAVLEQFPNLGITQGAFFATENGVFNELTLIAADDHTTEILKNSAELLDALRTEFGVQRFNYRCGQELIVAVFEKLNEQESGQ
ncbi:helix-turn-helix domain-containing protein [Pseudomonadota bacterium]